MVIAERQQAEIAETVTTPRVTSDMLLSWMIAKDKTPEQARCAIDGLKEIYNLSELNKDTGTVLMGISIGKQEISIPPLITIDIALPLFSGRSGWNETGIVTDTALIIEDDIWEKTGVEIFNRTVCKLINEPKFVEMVEHKNTTQIGETFLGFFDPSPSAAEPPEAFPNMPWGD